MPRLKQTGVIHGTLIGYDVTVVSPWTRSRAIRMKCMECCYGNAARLVGSDKFPVGRLDPVPQPYRNRTVAQRRRDIEQAQAGLRAAAVLPPLDGTPAKPHAKTR